MENKEIFTDKTLHTNIDVKKENILCELCSFLCKDEVEFENHLNIHSATNCQKIQTFRLRSEKNEDNDSHPKRKSTDRIENSVVTSKYLCGTCNLTFLTNEEFSSHNNSHENNEIQQTKVELKESTSSGETQCEICGKVFSRMANLSSHFVTHTNDYFCYVCCNSYRTQFKLDQHMTQHSEQELSYRKDNPLLLNCSYGCNLVFNSKLKLFKHKKCHENVIEFQCELCGKEFETLRRLQTHKKKHEEDTKCVICDKQLSNRRTLKDHLRLHSGEKPFECSICKRQFRCQSGLKSHEIIHTGKKNYKCGQCSRTFARSNYLKDHMRIHFNEKPFVCKYCNSSFTQKSVLNTHISKKHRHCSLCKNHVGGVLQLRMHMWKYHKEQQSSSVRTSSNNDAESLVEETVGNSADEEEFLQ